jgi:3-oxoadipate enol-lactonase
MPLARVRDIEMYFERAGSGREVLFIGGTGGDLRQKPSVFDGPLARGFDLLSYDQRGLGRTSKPDRPYRMSEYADDAAGLLDDVGWDRVAVVGVSFGGMVAQELVLRHPARVERLVLACTSSGGKGGASFPLHELAKLPAEEQAFRSLELGDTRYDAAWRAENPEAAQKLLALMASRRAPAASGAEGQRAAMGARRQLEARAGHDTWSRLPEIRIPTYCCGGAYDGIAPPENIRALADRIPGAWHQLFDGGHLFLVQDRTAFPRILEFLARDTSD